MTVKELIEELRTMPQDAQVIFQKDSEGNVRRLVNDKNTIYNSRS